MKICILIQIHKNFDFVLKLINRLRHKDVDIWLNFDKKNTYNPDQFPNCFFIKDRVDIKWGDITLGDSFMRAIKEIILSNYKYDRIIYISGQDYLLKPINEIVDFYSKKENLDKEFLSYRPILDKDINLKARYQYHRFKNRYLDFLSRKISKKRDFIKNYEPYYGSNWLNITLEAAKYLVLKYEQDNFYKYFKYSIAMDEIIPHSILLSKNSPFKDKVINDNKRYIDWSNHKKGLNNGNPNILEENDFEKIINSNADFARKFDMKTNSKIIDMLDNYLDNKK